MNRRFPPSGYLRRECLDRLLIVGRRHLKRVVAAYALHYNEASTAPRQVVPLGGEPSPSFGDIDP